MTQSTNIGALAAALAKAQKALRAAAKDGTNPHFRSKYATLASVVDSVRDALADNGLSYTQLCGGDGTTATIETVLMHSSGEWISSIASAKPMKADAQGVGSVYTYLRRYGLTAIVGIATDDDDDGNAASQRPASKPVKEAPKQGLREVFNEVAKHSSRDAVLVLAAATAGYKVTSPMDVKPEDEARVTRALLDSVGLP